MEGGGGGGGGGGLPMLNCLLQHTLRSLCSCSDSSNPSKWVYAIFWRILPRNYPPPKWDHGGGLLDRAKGNKRNWILVWEDGFCDFCECERAGSGYVKGRFGADIFFKMTHEVYNFGEGLVGKVASDNSHKWVFRDSPTDNDPTFISSWNFSIDPQPRAWEAQFNSGIETIAVISVREGAIQLGSFEKVVEDLNLVLSIQRKFSYIQSIPGIYAVQRPHIPIPNPTMLDYNKLMQSNQALSGINDDKPHLIGLKRQNFDQANYDWPTKSISLGYNSPHHPGSLPFYTIPPPLPPMHCNHAGFLPKVPLYYAPQGTNQDSKGGDEYAAAFNEIPAVDVKLEVHGIREKDVEEEKPSLLDRH